eukprot:TRINITY_DN10870_c0_g1_i1.p1 TRINITY_DN10870_c0_g1~~TRINITY_DN10870_c0_g1_i1.p1  ORF type:complete len:241 (+),score=27.23 TRINITY_DN10870_c0_g1_i1:2-724(+)
MTLMLPRIMSIFSGKTKRRNLLENHSWPSTWPYTETDLQRYDRSDDSKFYDKPRFVHHIDDEARAALTSYYEEVLKPNSSILDICSSWVSHLPTNVSFEKAVGIGMNKDELAANTQLTQYYVHDLNTTPTLNMLSDSSFDVATCVVSVDYLIHPKELFSELQRVLKPGGLAIMSFSNRCFPTKVVNIWRESDDQEHVNIVGSYFHFTPGFDEPEAFDISPYPGKTDPMFIVQSRKTISNL